MTTIYLIRHGQASVGTDNYDVLSSTGETQADVLGQHLANTHIDFDAIYSGSLKRQMDTARIATGATDTSANAGNAVVPLQVMPEFNEYRHGQIFNKYLPMLAKTDAEIGAAAEDGSNGLMTQSVFLKLMMTWVDDSAEHDDLESWQQFNQRIANGIEHILDTHPSQTVAVFTSGGVITSLFRSMFGLPPERMFELNWNINNAGITSLKYRDRQPSLREYNNISHLLLRRDKKLITQI
jgi:broad specificity phosphatase PhoE